MAFSQGSEVPEDNNDHEKVSAADDDEFPGDDECPEDVECLEDDEEEQHHPVRHRESEPELEGILHDECTVPMPKPTGIIPWLEKEYKSSRGFELGTFDASLLPNVWKKQSANWDDLTLGYVSDIVSLVHDFILALLSAICEYQRIRSALMSMLMDGLIERYKKGMDHAKFILFVEKTGTPLTANRYFADNLEK